MKIRLLALLCLAATTAFAQTYKRKTNLPHIFINTYNHVPVSSKNTYVQGTLRRVDTEDQLEVIDSLNIRGRGNSTWNMAKKPYRLKFNHKEKFLGQGYAKAKSWTLIANHGDKTMLRNALTFILGEWIGLKNSPAHEFVDLTLNNTYQGTYMVSDHMEVRPHRVNVEEQDYPLADESDITGGYLFEFDGFRDGRGFTTSRAGSYIRVHYPDEDEIAASQMNYAKQYFSDIESCLYASYFKDPERGYRSMMDTTSLVNWYLATEISANIDGFYSTYCYKHRGDDHLYWGPLWDYDIAYANDNRKGDTTRKLMRNDAYSGSQAWVQRMWQDEWFQQAVARRYRELRENGLDSFMLAQVDSMAVLIDESQQLNFKKWGINKRAYNERVLYSTYDEYLRDLRDFIKAHNAWLATQFVVKGDEKPQEPEQNVELPQGVYCRLTNVGTGTAIDTDGSHVFGWNVTESRSSQLWDISSTAGGRYRLYNAQSGLALTDPDQGIGAQLTVGSDDDDASLWQIVAQDGCVNLISVKTGNCANLSGGGSSNGTPLLSYTSDDRNAVSSNRRWRVNATSVPLPHDAVDDVDADYALAYDPSTCELHFGGELPLHFTARVFTAGGRNIGSFNASDRFAMQSQPSGLYIITWTYSGRKHSVKFMR